MDSQGSVNAGDEGDDAGAARLLQPAPVEQASNHAGDGLHVGLLPTLANLVRAPASARANW